MALEALDTGFAIRLGGRTILLIRKVCFRRTRTVFFQAYCDERDLPQLQGLFLDCRNSMKPKGDA